MKIIIRIWMAVVIIAAIPPALFGHAKKVAEADDNPRTDSIHNNITFLNAANFDFSEKLGASYLGKLNIFALTFKARLLG